MKNDNLYQEEIEEESVDTEEEEEDEDEDDDIINFDEIDMSMNKSTISNIKANVHRENELGNIKYAIDNNVYIESSPNREKEVSSNKNAFDNNITVNLTNTNVNTVINNQQTSKLEEKDSKNTSNIMNLANVSNMKDLKNIDLNDIPRDEILNFLMNSDKIYQQEKVIKKLNTSNSVISTNNLKKKSQILTESQNTNKFQLNNDNDPEYTNDFSMASLKVLNNMMRNPNTNENPDLLKLLTSDNPEDFSKLEAHHREKIAEKIDKFLEKKSKNLEVIQEKVNEEFEKVYTFTPQINREKALRRNFEEFINDQFNHIKRTNEKIQNLKNENDRKNFADGYPKISEKSKKIFEEKLKSDVPVYMRLYQKKMKENKSDLLKAPNSKSNIKSQAKNDERLNNLYQDHFKRQQKLNELTKKYQGQENEKLEKVCMLGASNKFLLKKFVKQFRSEIVQVEGFSNKLNYNQLNLLLKRLNFLSQKLPNPNDDINSNLNENAIAINEKKLVLEIFENLKDYDNLVNIDHLFIFLLSILNLYEVYLLKIHQMNDIEEESKIDDQSSNLESKKSLTKDQSKILAMQKKKEERMNILINLNNEMLSQINKPCKYGGMDEENNFICPIVSGRSIFKDFNLFYINWSNLTYINRKKKKNSESEHTFKPKINQKSVKMSNAYRQKIQIEAEQNYDVYPVERLRSPLHQINTNNNNFSNNILSPKSYNAMFKKEGKEINNINSLNYVDIQTLKKKNKETLYAKLKEENEKKELESCTFKPKINTYNNESNIIKPNAVQRIDQLYKKGINAIYNKKDKTKDELDVEKYGKECTFKPNLEKDTNINIQQQTRSNYLKDKNVEKYNERMKQARIEKEIKENAHRRGEILSPERYNDKNRSDNRTIYNNNFVGQNMNNFAYQQSHSKERMRINSLSPQKDSSREQIYRNQGPVAKILTKDAEEQMREYLSQNDPGKKDSIPLLIIDVNIKPGVKKKIYVFDGDTPEDLADRFAREHNLGQDIKGKLKQLVQNHMSRLLMKIEEENQSISDKSTIK